MAASESGICRTPAAVFGVAKLPSYTASRHREHTLPLIEVLPAQREQLATSQARAYRESPHGPSRHWQFSEQRACLGRRQGPLVRQYSNRPRMTTQVSPRRPIGAAPDDDRRNDGSATPHTARVAVLLVAKSTNRPCRTVCFANIPIALRMSSRTITSRAEESARAADVNDSIAQEDKLGIAVANSRGRMISLRRWSLSGRTTENRSGRRATIDGGGLDQHQRLPPPGHNHRNNSQSTRSVGRKRRCARAHTARWWRRASVSSTRSRRVCRGCRRRSSRLEAAAHRL